MITAKEIVTGYLNKELLFGVSFSIAAGDMILLEGANGSGKTTLARSILGSIPVLQGKLTNTFRCSSYVPQKSILDEQYPMTIQSLVLGGARAEKTMLHLLKRSSSLLKKARDCMQRTGVEQYANLPVREASGGQLQRALISRALMPDPDFILLDEPFANLDKHARIAVGSLLSELNSKDKVAILVIDHAGTVPLTEYRKLTLQDKSLIEH